MADTRTFVPEIGSVHTEEPWTIVWGAIQGGTGHRILDSSGTSELDRVAKVLYHPDLNRVSTVYDEERDEETKANALLITAAPELYREARGALTALVTGRFGKPVQEDRRYRHERLLSAAIAGIRNVLAKTEGPHTPGPWDIHWSVIQDGEGHCIVDSSGLPGLEQIAHVLFHEDKDGETKANAHLIAAAPDMRHALEGALTALVTWTESQATDPAIRANRDQLMRAAIGAIEAVIAKAEGRKAASSTPIAART